MDVVREGYSGEAKGVKQVLWERGWCVDGMIAANADPEKNLGGVLGKLSDLMTKKQHRSRRWRAVDTSCCCRRSITRRLRGWEPSTPAGGCRRSSFAGRSMMRSHSIFAPQHGRIDVPQ